MLNPFSLKCWINFCVYALNSAGDAVGDGRAGNCGSDGGGNVDADDCKDVALLVAADT